MHKFIGAVTRTAGRLRYLAVTTAGVTGVLILTAGPAHAFHVVGNHCEPLRRH